LPFYNSLVLLYEIICFYFFIRILLSVHIFYVFVSLPSVLYDCLKLKMPWVPAPPTASTSSDFDQSCRERGTTGYAAFRHFQEGSDKSVLYALENRAQHRPLLSCVIRRFLFPQNSVINVRAKFCKWPGKILASFCIFFTSSCNSNILAQFVMSQ